MASSGPLEGSTLSVAVDAVAESSSETKAFHTNFTGVLMLADKTHSLTLNQAAEEVGVHYMTIYRHVRTGRLLARRTPAGWVVERHDLESYLRHGADVSMERRQAQVEDRLIAGDDVGVWSLIEANLGAGMDAGGVLARLIVPSMRSIGQRWQMGELTILDEHLASAATSVIIARLGPHISRIPITKGVVIVGTLEGDTHALAATVLSDLLRAAGFDSIDLGANTPAASFAEQTELSDPTAVLLSIQQAPPPDAQATLHETVKAIRAASKTAHIAVGGPGTVDLDAASIGTDSVLNDVDEFIATIS